MDKIMEFKEALAELRKEENKRKFEQTIDLIVNLRGIDLKRDNVNLVVSMPHQVREKKICGFFNSKSEIIKAITKPEFAKYKDKKSLKNLVKRFDFFIANAALMPAVATTFGKVLGPAGKMPSPQLGIVTQETESQIKPLLEKISKSVKVRLKEASIKLSIGRESMPDAQILENIDTVYKAILTALPNQKENIRSVMVKTTMSKAFRVEVK